MTTNERLNAVRSLGYTPRQAAFLTLVAHHGGYFLRRQYVRFLGQADGAIVTDLLKRLVTRRHAIRHLGARDTHIYHLSSRPLYAAIDEHDSRNRRPAPPPAIVTKLMTLDVVLGWRDHRVLGTETEKVAFFIEDCGVPRNLLPATVYTSPTPAGGKTTRYFVDKSPVAVAPGSSLIVFAYVQGCASGMGGLTSFLRQYQPLFRALGSVSVAYCTNRTETVEQAHRAWEQAFNPQRPTPKSPALAPRLAAHFRQRRGIESGHIKTLTPQDLSQFQADMKTFGSSEHLALYRQWCAATDAPREDLVATSGVASSSGRPRFEPVILPYSYPYLQPREDGR